MVGIGVGIGLGMSQQLGTGPKRATVEDFANIGETRLMEANVRGARIVFAPYAIFMSESDDAAVTVVVLRSSDAALNGWVPQEFKVNDLTDIAVRAETFLPNQSFDRSIYGNRLIGAVDLV